MPRKPNYAKRIAELEDAVMHLLEVQIHSSTPNVEEWETAVKDARRVVRNRLKTGWKGEVLEWYNLKDRFEDEIVRGNDRMLEELEISS